MSIEGRVTAGDDREMNDDDDDRELERMLAFYSECCKRSAVDALPDDEARELARWFHNLLAPAPSANSGCTESANRDTL